MRLLLGPNGRLQLRMVISDPEQDNKKDINQAEPEEEISPPPPSSPPPPPPPPPQPCNAFQR